MEKQATREAYGKALEALGAEREDIVVLDADLSKSTKTNLFAKKFPERFFDMGIAEQNMLGVAAGLAAAGKVPFASTFAVFATGRAYDQIRNSICYPRLNVKIAATHAGITVGEDGGSHQALEDINLMRGLPNMTVLVPADGPETTKAIRAAAEMDGPVYIRLGRSGVPVITTDDTPFEIGKGLVLKEGSDVTLIACGMMVSVALDAAELLAADGVSAAVIDMSSIKPIDRALVDSALSQVHAQEFRTRRLTSLSGGQRQRAYIAMALAQDTPLILLDEPTTYLDVSIRYDIMDLVKKLNQKGKTIIMVLHDLELALEYSDTILLMKKGRIQTQGSPEDVIRTGLLDTVFKVHTLTFQKDGRTYYHFAKSV